MKRRAVVAALLAILACTLNAVLWIKHADSARVWRSTTISLSSPAYVGRVKPALETIPTLHYAIYGETPGIAVQTAAYPDRRAELTLLRFTGDIDCIAFFPLSGAMPSSYQPDTCAIDRVTAFLLWGSEDVVGQSLRANDRDYSVSGVLDIDHPMMVVHAQFSDAIERVAIQVQSKENCCSKAEEVAAMLSVEGSISDDMERVTLWRFFALAPCFFAALFLPITLPMGKSLRAAIYCVLVGGILFLLLSTMPTRFFPNRWSDLEFYTQLPRLLQAFVGEDIMIRDMLLEHDSCQLAWISLVNCAIVFLLFLIGKKWINKTNVLTTNSRIAMMYQNRALSRWFSQVSR